jgi:DNA polymerase/3'-5' exonuclease PolX
MNGVNTLHAEMVQRIESAGNTDTSELQDIDSQIIQVIQKIKDTEENDRLKMMYGRYPTPSVKP